METACVDCSFVSVYFKKVGFILEFIPVFFFFYLALKFDLSFIVGLIINNTGVIGGLYNRYAPIRN